MNTETKTKNENEVFVFENMGYQSHPQTTTLDCVVISVDAIGTLKDMKWQDGGLVPKTDEEMRSMEKRARNDETINRRLAQYGSIGSQLDEMFHDYDAWKERIAAIKLAEPLEE